jgi:hypothetical protein
LTRSNPKKEFVFLLNQGYRIFLLIIAYKSGIIKFQKIQKTSKEMLKWNFNHLKFNERLSAAQTWPSARNRWQIAVDSPHFGGNLGRQLLLTIAAAIVVAAVSCRRHSNHHQQQKQEPSLGNKMERI